MDYFQKNRVQMAIDKEDFSISFTEESHRLEVRLNTLDNKMIVRRYEMGSVDSGVGIDYDHRTNFMEVYEFWTMLEKARDITLKEARVTTNTLRITILNRNLKMIIMKTTPT
ncbi:unnamed protein product [Rhizophagus irregularis]|uniref:Uncharacterized protein n=1 Tax=Rhizophagus irregularis TaxID=588596 RepID=A0A915Z280_9GLOM|nr:unnamed protein product [Rhizophagus irregularis]